MLSFSKGDRQDYRLWVGQKHTAKNWYVDGRANGWGRDNVSKTNDAGRYPDKPKKTLFGAISGENKGGIITEVISNDANLNYSYEKDKIYVVGELSAADEAEALTYGTNTQGHKLPLVLYRYPGGHLMSNGLIDNTAGTVVNPSWGASGSAGPGANYGAMANVQQGQSMTMRGVVLDGLYNCTPEEAITHEIPEWFNQNAVIEPIVVTRATSTLSLSDSTVIKRGYNNTDAADWYTDPDYKSYMPDTPNGPAPDGAIIPNGGAMFVDSTATVNVSGKVYIKDNKQKKGEEIITSNVYLPTFASHLIVNGALDETTEVGVTSPRRNKEESYLSNTLSPVAKIVSGDATSVAVDAWNNDNFTDDQNWFFGNKGQSTYYTGSSTRSDNPTLSFGWTWANVVRQQPTGFAYNNIDSPEDLAWLISQSTGMNGQTATNFNGVSMKQTRDIDLGQYVWVPLGDSIAGSGHKPFSGSYDGQGHLINNLDIAFIGRGDHRYERHHYGLFGYVWKGIVDRTFVVSGTASPEISLNYADDIINIGGLVGCLDDATVSNSEAALNIYTPNSANTNLTTGGLVGMLMSGEVHSSMAMPWIYTYDASKGAVGGLVGSAVAGNIYNSFVNGLFSLFGTPKAGGLLGYNGGATMKNCYVNWGTEGSLGTTFKSIVNEVASGTVDYCYDKQNADVAAGDAGTHSKEFTQTSSSPDVLGYMYSDNVAADTALFQRLNKWVDANNASGHRYARWARPALYEINGDLPVLLLNEYDVTSGGVPVSHQGSFRSVGTYADTRALQYGGTVRDGNELDAALTRPLHLNGENPIAEFLFVYGDVNNVSQGLAINRAKVSIYEDAAITNPGSLNTYANTYVGVSFDNSHMNGMAYSTPGMNYQDELALPRDWHMFSTPLSNAPMGFDYQGDNVAGSDHYNNPWDTPNNEFSWLTQAGSEECGQGADYRYWMKTFQANDQSTDGYFPTLRGGLISDVNSLFIVGSDECPEAGKYRYPYGMDLYTWTEPDYHWINFKRNGPNHWHSDDHKGIHDHIDYQPVAGAGLNVNETNLIVGRGYMGAITTETFMQSHGMLNTGDKTIALTNTSGSLLPGWNLVGNPYHGYLDFDKVGDPNGPNANVLSHHMNGNVDEGAFYVIYDADKFTNGDASTAYRYYPIGGSTGGDYADRFLHPHQGFYVRTEQQNGGNLTFTESMLGHRRDVELAGETGTFRGEEKPAYPLVNLYLNSDKGCADVTVIEFERPEWGGARKMKELRVGDGLFYAHHDDAYYAALFAQEGVDRVPLWFEAKDDDIFTMKWNLANADFHSMYLIDNITGVQYDMLKNNTYCFEGHKDDYRSRFLIVFDLTGLEEEEEEVEHNFAFFNGSEWVVTGDGDLQFIDVLGQVLAQKHVSGQTHIYLPQVADGAYLFRLINGKETKIQKVVITK